MIVLFFGCASNPETNVKVSESRRITDILISKNHNKIKSTANLYSQQAGFPDGRSVVFPGDAPGS
jgi:hypothetical protein